MNDSAAPILSSADCPPHDLSEWGLCRKCGERHERPAAPRRRWMVRHALHVRWWGVVAEFRAYHGNGSPNFEFAFRLRFPRLRRG